MFVRSDVCDGMEEQAASQYIMFNVPRDGQMGARAIKRDNTIRAIMYVLKDFNEFG